MRKYEKTIINEKCIEKTKGFYNLFEEEYRFDMPAIIYPYSYHTYVRCKCGNKFRIKGEIIENYRMEQVILKSSIFAPGGNIKDIFNVYELINEDEIILCQECGAVINKKEAVILGENRDLASLNELNSSTVVKSTDMILNKINYFVNDFTDENGEVFKKYSLSLMMMLATCGKSVFPVVNKHALSIIISFNEKDGQVRYSVKDVNTNRLLYTINISNIVYDQPLRENLFLNKSNTIPLFLSKLNSLGYFPSELKERMIKDLGLDSVLIKYGVENLNSLSLLDFVIFYKFKNLSKDLNLESMINLHILINSIYYFKNVIDSNNQSLERRSVPIGHASKLLELRRSNFLNTVNKGRKTIHFDKQMLEIIREAFIITTIGNVAPSEKLLENVNSFFDNKNIQEKLILNPLAIFGQYSLFIPLIKDEKIWLDLLNKNEELMNDNIGSKIPSLKAFYSVGYIRHISFNEQSFYFHRRPDGEWYEVNNNDSFFREGSDKDGINLLNLSKFKLDELLNLISLNEVCINNNIRKDLYIGFIATEKDFKYDFYNDLFKNFFQTNQNLSPIEYFNFKYMIDSFYHKEGNFNCIDDVTQRLFTKKTIFPTMILETDKGVIEIKEILLKDILSIPGFAGSYHKDNVPIDDKTRFLLVKNNNHPDSILIEIAKSESLGDVIFKSILGEYYKALDLGLIDAIQFYSNYYNITSFIPMKKFVDYNLYKILYQEDFNKQFGLNNNLKYIDIKTFSKEMEKKLSESKFRNHDNEYPF